jgi:hypothetical protein
VGLYYYVEGKPEPRVAVAPTHQTNTLNVTTISMQQLSDEEFELLGRLLEKVGLPKVELPSNLTPVERAALKPAKTPS